MDQSEPIRGQYCNTGDQSEGGCVSKLTPQSFLSSQGLFRFVCHHTSDKLIGHVREDILNSFYSNTRVLLKVFLHSFADCGKINDNILFCQSTLAPSFSQVRSSHILTCQPIRHLLKYWPIRPLLILIISLLLLQVCASFASSGVTISWHWQVSSWRDVTWRKLCSFCDRSL